jgi:peptidoglycan-associated lipoprotein
MLMPVAAGLVVAALAGCASRTPGAGSGAVDPERSGAGVATSPGAGGAAAGGAAGGELPGVSAPGATMFPAMPAPKEFGEAPGLRDIHFDFNRATVRPEDGRVLDANARWLQAHPGVLVLIEGHADERGTSEYNLALAESRAKATRDQLVARGVAPSRVTLVSYGEERPTCRDAAEPCWAKNRRAHFLVSSGASVSAVRP